MSEQTKPDAVLNLQGLLCPIPIVKVAQAVKGIPVGGIIEATATDPGVLADIPAWCRATGNELIEIRREGKLVVFRLRRTK